jgi:replicative DNA helicase
MTPELLQKIENIIARNQQTDDKTVVFQLKQLLYDNEILSEKEVKSIAELVTESLRQLKAESFQNDIIKTGFRDLDRLIGGFLPGELVIIGGRPAMGKTAFLVDLSLNISKIVPLLYITLELSDEQLTNRFIASLSEIPAHLTKQQAITSAEWEHINSIEKKITDHQLFLLDNQHNTISILRTHCEKQIRENGVKVIIIDYLQLASSYQHRKYRELEVSFVCRELKNIAKKHNVCIIASSQLNRGIENRSGMEGKRPQLADLRESGAIEQDADKVILLHRPEYYNIFTDNEGNSLTGIAEIIVAKNRNGITADVRLHFDYKIPKFRDFVNFKNDFAFSSGRLKDLEEVPF